MHWNIDGFGGDRADRYLGVAVAAYGAGGPAQLGDGRTVGDASAAWQAVSQRDCRGAPGSKRATDRLGISLFCRSSIWRVFRVFGWA